MSQVPDLVIDWITIENTIRGKEWFSPEVGNALQRAKDCEIPDADQLMAYIEILKDRFTRDRSTKLSDTIAEYCEHKGPHIDEGFVDFSGRIIQGLVQMQKAASNDG